MTTPKLSGSESGIYASSVEVSVEPDEVVLEFFQASSSASADKPTLIQRIVIDKETADTLRESLDAQPSSHDVPDASASLQALFEYVDTLPDDEKGLSYEELHELRREAQRHVDKLYGTDDQ